MISAFARDRVIGGDKGGIPWRLPRDTEHFRGYTRDKFMLLGRRTFLEMAGWFTTQRPIVLTTNASFTAPGALVAGSVPGAIALAEAEGADELVVSGGASVYAAALPVSNRLILTMIDAAIPGVAFFPDYEASGSWKTLSSRSFPPDEANRYGMTFVELERLA